MISPMRRVPPDVIAFVEERQRPRETFGAALRRLLGIKTAQ